MKGFISLLLFFVLLLMTGTTYAFEGVSTTIYQLPADETHRGDLAVDAQQVVIEGVVDGDLFVFAEQVQIKGRVTGDVFSFAVKTDISGSVDGNIRSLTQNLTITGAVAKSVTTISQRVLLEESGKVGTNMLLLASNVDVKGKVAREVNGLVDALRISGQVDEGISLLKSRTLRLDAPAVIGGDLTYSSPERAVIGSGVVLKGSETHAPLGDDPAASPLSFLTMVFLGLTSFLCALLVWLGVRFLFPAGLYSIHRQFAQRRVKIFVWGAALLLGVPLLAIILLVTVVGIPIAVALLLAYLALGWAAKVFVGSWLGLQIAQRMKWTLPPLLAELIGVVLLQCLLFIPVVGWLFALPVWMASLGAMAGSVWEVNKRTLC